MAAKSFDLVQPQTPLGVRWCHDVDDRNSSIYPDHPGELAQDSDRLSKIRECVRAGYNVEGTAGVRKSPDVTHG